jgi:hypothetical protein
MGETEWSSPRTIMRNRGQRRQRAILPLKVSANGEVHLGHTLDISASGARLVMTTELQSETLLTIEYKYRRSIAKVSWCRPMKGRKYEYELGIRFQNTDDDFWGVKLSLHDQDIGPNEVAAMPFNKVMSLITPKRSARVND